MSDQYGGPGGGGGADQRQRRQVLNLGSNALSPAVVAALCRCVSRNVSLTSLHLAGCSLSDQSCADIVEALDANRLARLRELYLGNNRAARGTAHRLAGCMRALAPDSVQFSGLRTIGALSLAGNRISDAGGAELILALEDNESVHMLDLGANELGPEAAAALRRMVARNGALRELRVERNAGLELHLEGLVAAVLANEASALRMLHSSEPLAPLCAGAGMPPTSLGWDNRAVLRFLHDVRRWYGPPPPGPVAEGGVGDARPQQQAFWVRVMRRETAVGPRRERVVTVQWWREVLAETGGGGGGGGPRRVRVVPVQWWRAVVAVPPPPPPPY